MTVLIAGGGIAGLSLGLSLHQIGVPFRILEAVREIKPLGVGINLQPHATRELFELGLEDALDGIGLRTEEVAYFSAQGQLIWAEARGAAAGYGWPQFSLNRGKLQMVLYDALIARAGAEVVRTGVAVTDWSAEGNEVSATLTDRKTGESLGIEKGDILIACDGINSVLRNRMYPDEGPAHWGGTMMWRGITRGPMFRTGRTVAMAGQKDVKFVCYPIADDGEGSVLNWIADLTMPERYRWRQQDWNRRGVLEDFLPAFEDWSFDWLDIPAVIRGADQIYEYPMVDRDPLPGWCRGPVALLGDAAHAMYPIGSNVASQCILDARHLARAIRAHGATETALLAYEGERREKMNALVLANRGDGPDKILDIVAARARDGFDDIEAVMPLSERKSFADGYKAIAGMDIAALNASPPILPRQER
ncbi:MAG: flavin-dependent oxidoreductase [Pseudomonadota bacterium]